MTPFVKVATAAALLLAAAPAAAQVIDALDRQAGLPAGLALPVPGVAVAEEPAALGVNPAAVGFVGAPALQAFRESERDEGLDGRTASTARRASGRSASATRRSGSAPAKGRSRASAGTRSRSRSATGTRGRSASAGTASGRRTPAIAGLASWDAGLTLRPWRHLSIGAAMLGRDGRLGGKKLPLRYDLGVATRLLGDALTLSADLLADDRARDDFHATHLAFGAAAELRSGAALGLQLVVPVRDVPGASRDASAVVALSWNAPHAGAGAGVAATPARTGWLVGARASTERYPAPRFGPPRAVGGPRPRARPRSDPVPRPRRAGSLRAAPLPARGARRGRRGARGRGPDRRSPARRRSHRGAARGARPHRRAEAGARVPHRRRDARVLARHGRERHRGAAGLGARGERALHLEPLPARRARPRRASPSRWSPRARTRAPPSRSCARGRRRRRARRPTRSSTTPSGGSSRTSRRRGGCRRTRCARSSTRGCSAPPRRRRRGSSTRCSGRTRSRGGSRRAAGRPVRLAGPYRPEPARARAALGHAAGRRGDPDRGGDHRRAAAAAGSRRSPAPRRSSSQLRRAAADDDVKAIVLRIESPGGDGLASDLIWRAVVRARERKPVVASMGDIAASGGYLAAVGGGRDRGRALDAHRVDRRLRAEARALRAAREARGRARRVGARRDSPSSRRSASRGPDQERRAVERQIDAFYRLFVDRVAEGRKARARGGRGGGARAGLDRTAGAGARARRSAGLARRRGRARARPAPGSRRADVAIRRTRRRAAEARSCPGALARATQGPLERALSGRPGAARPRGPRRRWGRCWRCRSTGWVRGVR